MNTKTNKLGHSRLAITTMLLLGFINLDLKNNNLVATLSKPFQLSFWQEWVTTNWNKNTLNKVLVIVIVAIAALIVVAAILRASKRGN